MSIISPIKDDMSVDTRDVSSMDISLPTEVKHVSHVTFDRFNGFLGFPTDLQPDVPRRVPSASASVFGVSAKSMQCSYDDRGNSVPTILLMMQRRLYSEGGLKAEGIFRINAENSREAYVRNKLNRGVVPRGVNVHCLAGLIKAWLRELPSGVLDSLTPEQVMHCNTEEDCIELLKLVPPTEAALLDWAINLMADVMAVPLTALIHAVQVMNFLKTLILKTLREREESAAEARLLPSFSDSPTMNSRVQDCEAVDACASKETATAKFLRSATLSRLECGPDYRLWSNQESDGEEDLNPFQVIAGIAWPYDGMIPSVSAKFVVYWICLSESDRPDGGNNSPALARQDEERTPQGAPL
ncbi:Rho GTPase-activating protein 3 [Hibiscus syriacus]|uniref:Rho GTPase-activating protein 3 n=1 Tax=Hibiscus syriacus TaxID=106335 RepID=A0A6A3C892_HIBSY|nr:Rho GTPase-activating protein 3 [Hibiscus syriacus]